MPRDIEKRRGKRYNIFYVKEGKGGGGLKELISLPASEIAAFEGGAEREIRAAGCDGAELIWSGEDLPAALPCPDCLGYHLVFYPDWIDLWNEDFAALERKFGSEEKWRAFFGGGREELVATYAADMARAAEAGAKYAVFHVSDVSVEEGYTYEWLHSDEAVIDAAAELINLLCEREKPPFSVLVENQWWPGFTFTDPKKTARLLDAIETDDKGILLDVGHLMNANTALRTQEEGAEYVAEMVRAHGKLAERIRAMHLHYSLSGEYVRANTGRLPADLPEEYFERFAYSYAHILNIDRHQPWTSPAVRGLVELVSPEYLTHELSASGPEARLAAVRIQRAALWGEKA